MQIHLPRSRFTFACLAIQLKYKSIMPVVLVVIFWLAFCELQVVAGAIAWR